MQSTSCKIPGWDESLAGIKIAGRNINNRSYSDDITLMTESEEKLNSLLMKVKEQSEKVDLKLDIQKTKIMASSPICSWQIYREKVETRAYFIFLGFKITVESNYSHEIKRHLLFGRKAMTILTTVLKSRDVTLPTKVHLVKAMVFSVVMYRGASWTTVKAEHRRTDTFELLCWERLSRVLWTAKDQPSQS